MRWILMGALAVLALIGVGILVRFVLAFITMD